MINKIQRKLSVQRFANGGIGTIPPASPYTMKGFQQAAMSAWPKIRCLLYFYPS